ncbi:DEAD/DEAH box helicase family protein [Cycloclasticus pugetii]|uniref:DEAD/DEAH box helicase family protein n=1 Tax=Cycloclasticus pugetii TaxID=34068 RepID=UPI003A8D5BED
MKSQNFEFLRPQYDDLASLGGLAETLLYIDPGSALIRLRAFGEELTKTIYAEERLPRLGEPTFSELLKSSIFVQCLSKRLVDNLHFLRIKGNDAAHGGKGHKRDAMVCLGYAYELARYMAVKYGKQTPASLPEFVDIQDTTQQPQVSQSEIKALKAELEKQKQLADEHFAELEKERAKQLKHLDPPAYPDQLKRQQESDAVADSLQWNEEKTRELLIDAMLAQAGWDVGNKDCVGIEVNLDFEDNKTGKGRADYVLWGGDGKPLAVVEVKRTSNDSHHTGREQARFYANSLEQQFGQRPVIFYTNGYETYIWDDVQYNSPRIVYGFYSQDSLNYLIYQRSYRDNQLEQNNPNLKIADRLYQIDAIKSVAKTFQEQRRKALIIQATGTGKTRVSIALADLMLNAGWAKRVLFLCDRKELRTQANDAFKTNLPSEPRCEIGETNHIDEHARIYVSTYPGMMNRFSQLDVGFFDLIIADESHRSIYNRYRDIFDYFDALQVGLTATPVKFVSRNTFDMFGCETTDPTYQFDLKQAIEHEPPYLCDFKVKDVTTEFLRNGIHYTDLTDEQKRQLEDDLGVEVAQNASYEGKDIGRKIYSRKTDQEILVNLMDNGIKDETNSLVGKTIIFANNQKHAEHLESLFCELYPQYGNKVCKVIHNKVSHVESVIKEFKKGDNEFRIAISVDMMDTGIDVPEVVNLVFAKTVKSYVKFWQMIGRGTRLCKNLFGPGKDKSEFLIFDHYGNFEFFEQEYKEPNDAGGKPLLQTCFEARVNLAIQALKNHHREGFDTAIALIKADLSALPRNSVAVRKELRQVDTLIQTDRLQTLDATTQHLLLDTIAPLMAARPLEDKHATQLDRLMAVLETGLVEKSAALEDGRDTLLEQISTLAVSIQAVRQKQAIIDELNSSEFWLAPTIDKLENARTQVRGIMKFRQSDTSGGYEPLKTRTQDGELRSEVREHKLYTRDEANAYRRRVKELLDQLVSSNPVLQKIKAHEKVSKDDLKNLTSTILTSYPTVSLNTLNEFYGRTADQLHVTLQELIGLEPAKVNEHFTDFVHRHPNLTAVQVRFLDLLKTYIANNGYIDIAKLYEPPFTSVNPNGVDGVFKESDVDDLVAVLKPFIKQDVQYGANN